MVVYITHVDGTLHLNDLAFRERLSLASFYSSLVGASTGFGAAHALAIGVGGVSSDALRHMEVCAALIPLVLRQYVALIEENDGDPVFESMVLL
jgi:alcohol dehydrogenase class IV